MRGNVLDMAVAVIIGAAFGRVVSSLVADVIMPPIGPLLGKVDFSSLFLNLTGTPYPSLVAAKAVGAPPDQGHPVRALHLGAGYALIVRERAWIAMA